MDRDTGQAIENPVALYPLTDAFSTAHMARNWGDVVP
jgi:hypothetical protein